MDILKSLGLIDGQSPILAITKNTNFHILALYWDGTDIVPKWILRDERRAIVEIKDVDLVHKSLLGANLKSQKDGSLKLTFSFNILDKERDLYFAELESGQFALIYKHEDSAAYLNEVFVDLSTSKATCKSIFNGSEITEIVDINLGPFIGFI